MSIAEALRDRLRVRGHLVDVGSASTPLKPPSEYDAVIIGTELGIARDRRAIGDYISRHRERLDALASGLFVIARRRSHIARRHVDAFASELSWHPKFAAALERDSTSRFRSMMRNGLIAMLERLTGSRNGSNTDDVSELADAIAGELQRNRAAT
jgi:menaquinone-dependent protoporphyrinogen IX oxidase